MSLSHYSPQMPDRPVLREEHPGGPEFMVDPSIDRHDLTYLFKKSWKIIVFVPLACAALATGWQITRKPVYESSAMLLVDSSLDQLLQFEKVGSSGDSVRESLRSLEVAVVADSVVLRVIEKLDLRHVPGFLPAGMASNPALPDAKLLDFIQKNRISAGPARTRSSAWPMPG